MNNEIREILVRLSRYVITPDVRHDFDDLLDYITNLEQLEQDHKQANATLMQELTKKDIALQNAQDDFDRVRKEYVLLQNAGDSYEDELEDRIDKAIEYIIKNCDVIRLDNGYIIRSELTTYGLGDLLNILQNGSEKDG